MSAGPEEDASPGAGSVPDLASEGESLRIRGMLPDAASVLERALAAAPRSFEIRMRLAQVRRAQTLYDEAAALLEGVAREFPGEGAPWQLLALVRRESGRAAQALEPLERYAALRSHDATAWLVCAELALDLGHTEKAFALIGKARGADPHSGEARFLEGRARFEDGDTETAIDAYREAIRAAPYLGDPPGGRVLEAWVTTFPSWAQAGRGRCRTLAPSHPLTIPPARVEPSSEAHLWPARVEQTPEIFVGRLAGAEVLANEFPVLAPDNCFFLDGFVTSPDVYPRKHGPVKYASSDGRVLLDLPSAPIELDAVCVLLGRSNNYFHFLIESLPRIWSAEQAGLEREARALMPSGLHSTQFELLDLLGYPAARLEALPPGASARCRELVAPSLLSQGYRVSPLAVQFLRERILERVARVPDLPRRVYLSRNRMPRRHLQNEAELLPLLARHGFRTVYPETLGVAEQVRLFAQADAILSPDSSALANLAFASAAARIGVLNWRGLHKPLWACIAMHTGAHLTYIHADPILESSASIAHRDMRVEPSFVAAWLETL